MTGLNARNPAVAHLRRLSRRRSARVEANAFVIDGPVLLADALSAGVEIDAVYIEERALAQAWAVSVLHSCEALGVRRLDLADGVLASATDTATPQPIAAIGRMVTRPLRYFTSTATGLVFVIAGVSDPGNAGTILRSAEAAGAKGVIVCSASVDLHSPKTVRASAGSIFRVPIAVVDADADADAEVDAEVDSDVGDGADSHGDSTDVAVVNELARAGFVVLGTVATGGRPYDELDLTGPVAIVLGSEAHGLPAELDQALAHRVTIPMAGATESLNVAMAATIIGFESARQRRHPRTW